MSTRISITIETGGSITDINIEREQELPALIEAVGLLAATRRAEIHKQLRLIKKLWEQIEKHERRAKAADTDDGIDVNQHIVMETP